MIRVKQAENILKKRGVILTPEQLEEVLALLQKLATIAFEQDQKKQNGLKYFQEKTKFQYRLNALPRLHIDTRSPVAIRCFQCFHSIWKHQFELKQFFFPD